MTDPFSESWAFEKLSDVAAELGESPVWCEKDRSVWWVDVTGRKLLKTEVDDGRTAIWLTPEEIGFVVLAADDVVLVGMESGLFRFDAADGEFSLLVDLPDPRVRFNDAATDAVGRLWAATMDIQNSEPLGTLYRIDPDLSVYEIENGLRTPNGLAADDERGCLYFSDSHPDVRSIWVAPLEAASGRLGEKELFAVLLHEDGRPDGAAIDNSGNYWFAGVDGAALHALSPDGERLANVKIPIAYPTKIAFGETGLRTAFVTSKSGGTAGPDGYLLKARTGSKGRGETRFGWLSEASTDGKSA